MSRKDQVAMSVVGGVVAALVSWSVWLHLQSPADAIADPWQVWINVLEGYGVTVRYVGSREPYAYFLIGDFLPAYYKTPSCNATLPRTFELGKGERYIVVQDYLRGYSTSPTCDQGPTEPPR